MKKNISNAIIVVLVITSILGIMTIYEKKEQQHRVNELFIANLVEARCALSIDFANADESTRTYYSTRMSSNLYSAITILDLSSYKHSKNRNRLFSAIYNLYLCMTNSDTKWSIYTEKSESVNEYLTQIIEDVNNEDACDALANLAGELYFNK